ncbi:hypothetical protein EI94DRAFT_1733007 [Lactarius quietus]|nr:hypothetical protein EI94DRAFT_1733007 [Lactarius quietus]
MNRFSMSQTASLDVTGLAAPLQLYGPLFNWALYGVLCVQIYVYTCNFPRDRPSLKFIVYFVFLLETVQTSLAGADVYYWFIAGFGNVEQLENFHFSPIDIPVILAVISLIVQGHFCYHIRALKRWPSWICWIIGVAALTQSVLGMWLGIKSFASGRKYLTTRTPLYLWSISSALGNILIAVAMTLSLRRASAKFSSFVLIRVVRYTIETNALTASLAFTILVLHAAFPNKLYYIPVAEIIGKVYSNTFLVSLNSRIYFCKHEPPGHGDIAYLTASNRVHPTVQPSHCFAVPESRARAPIGDSFQLCAITEAMELGQGKGDDTSFNSSPSGARKGHLLPDDQQRTIEFPPDHGL